MYLFDYIKDRNKLNSELRASCRKAIPIIGDGNCLFRSLAFVLRGTEDEHPTIRHEVCEYLSQHRADFEVFPDVMAGWDDFLRKTRELRHYAGEPCILTAAQLYKITILVHSPRLPILRYDGGQEKVIELAFLGQN